MMTGRTTGEPKERRLANCPFCGEGGEDGLEYSHRLGEVRVECGCESAGPWEGSFAAAASAWNDVADLKAEVVKVTEERDGTRGEVKALAQWLNTLIDHVKREGARQQGGGHFQWKPVVIAAEAIAKSLADSKRGDQT